MRNVYRVLAYLLAVEVVVQAMAIAYAIAGLGKWVEDDGGVLNKQVHRQRLTGLPRRGRLRDPRHQRDDDHPDRRHAAAHRVVLRQDPRRRPQGRDPVRSGRPAGLPRDLLAQHPVRDRAARAERVRHLSARCR